MSVIRAAQPPGAAARAFVVAGGLLFAASLAYFAWFYLLELARRPVQLDTTAAVAINTGLFALFALHHSLFARSAARAWVARLVSSSLERAAYVWIASIALTWTCLFWQPFGSTLWTADGLARIVLRLLQIVGIAVSLRAGSVLDPKALAGLRQLDAPLPSSGIETAAPPLRDSGLYGFVRHPIYFGWLLIVWPAPTMTAAHALFAAVSTAYLLVAIVYEERSLHATYGDAYAAYARKVRYKVVPGIL